MEKDIIAEDSNEQQSSDILGEKIPAVCYFYFTRSTLQLTWSVSQARYDSVIDVSQDVIEAWAWPKFHITTWAE